MREGREGVGDGERKIEGAPIGVGHTRPKTEVKIADNISVYTHALGIIQRQFLRTV